MSQNCLDLNWAFGFRHIVSKCVHSLCDGDRQVIFYAVGHLGILYDCEHKTQTHLFGHKHEISASCVCPRRRYIATADIGPDAVIIVWDTYSGLSVRTFEKPCEFGIVSMDFDSDYRFLSVISAPNPNSHENEANQKLFIYDWANTEIEEPISEILCPSSHLQEQLRWSYERNNEIVTTGPHSICFYDINENGQIINAYSPGLSIAYEHINMSDVFTDSIFLPKPLENPDESAIYCITSTLQGSLIEWSLKLENIEDGLGNRRVQRVLKLCPDSGIMCLQLAHPLFVVGCTDGTVKFFDHNKRIVSWFEDINAGPIAHIAFHSPYSDNAPLHLMRGQAAKAFFDQIHDVTTFPEVEVPDFIVGTTSSLIIQMHGRAFHTAEQDLLHGEVLVEGFPAHVPSVAIHPTEKLIATCSHNGCVFLIDSQTKAIINLKKFDKVPQTLQFIPLDSTIIVGFTSGHVYILDYNLSILQELHHTKDSILRVDVAEDSKHVVAVDTGFCITAYRRYENEDMDSESLDFEWRLVGRYGAHTADITSSCLEIDSKGRTRFFSTGLDRCLMQFDIGHSDITEPLKMKVRSRVESNCIPTAVAFITRPGSEGRRDVLLTANNQLKIRVLNPKNQQITKTVLGPVEPFENPKGIRQMQIIKNADGSPSVYLIYSTHQSTIGLMRLPLDGNPFRYSYTFAHPIEITTMSLSSQNLQLVTCGGDDCSVLLFDIETTQLEEQVKNGGTDMQPFYSLLEESDAPASVFPYSSDDSGKQPSLLEHIKNLFYFMALNATQVDPSMSRDIYGPIPRDKVFELLAALGCFLSAEDELNIEHEITYDNEDAENVDLDTFLKMYVNHRPAKQVSLDHFVHAFRTISQENSETLDFDRLLDVLNEHGMSVSETLEIMSYLMIEDNVRDVIGDKIDAKKFVEEVLAYML
eukprot:TRINITY_DN3105_c0_g1_i1.p1 TRINITY_DN3105_c0_g1~~TRINITY_DN3105_c0_g1_i1.p1  ORF type:complete len:923 (-),score=203.39 TRINITY_DN3105_c0_g1_i1:28-2796(-)